MAEWWSGSDRGYRIRLTVNPVPNSINVANNTSRVRYTLTLFNTTLLSQDIPVRGGLTTTVPLFLIQARLQCWGGIRVSFSLIQKGR